MINIKLYNVEFSGSYADVFSDFNLLKSYLSTRQTMDLGDYSMNITDEGYFDITTNLTIRRHLNYIVFTEVTDPMNPIKLTAFVTKIEYNSKYIRIYYSIDKWHSYCTSAPLGLTLSSITGRIIRIGKVNTIDGERINKFLPVERFTGMPFVISQVKSDVNYCYIFVQIQYASTSDYDDISYMYGVISDTDNPYVEANESENIVKKLLVASLSQSFLIRGETPVSKYFNIGNLYIIPKYLIDNLQSQNFQEFARIGLYGAELRCFDATALFEAAVLKPIKSYNFTISENISNYGIGTYDKIHIIEKPNQAIRVSIFFGIALSSLVIFMSAEGEMIDITSSFYYERPMLTKTGEELGQERISRGLRAVSAVIGIISGGAGLLGGASQIAGLVREANVSGGMLFRTPEEGARYNTYNDYRRSRALNETISSGGQMINSYGAFAQSISNIPRMQGIKSNGTASFNFLSGLLLYTIEITNTFEISNAIKYEGYTTSFNIYRKNINSLIVADEINPIQIENPIIEGFSNEQQLFYQQIFSKGIRIHTKSNLS